MRQSIPTTLLVLASSFSSTYAQAPHADGTIVPFTSDLPVCASNCGPLYDVQGKCSPPNIPTVDDNCFCTDSRLAPFDAQGTAGVAQVCGATSCTAQADLAQVKTWFDQFCATKKNTGSTTTSAAPGATSSSASSGSGGSSSPAAHGNPSWLSTHTKWIIMLVVVVVAIVGGWIGAIMLRRRYIRKKEKEIEMRPPVAWGPHQMQGMTGGYDHGDNVRDAPRGEKGVASATNTPVSAMVTKPVEAKRGSKALRKSRQ